MKKKRKYSYSFFVTIKMSNSLCLYDRYVNSSCYVDYVVLTFYQDIATSFSTMYYSTDSVIFNSKWQLTVGTCEATKIIPTDTILRVLVTVCWNVVVLCRRRALSWWSESNQQMRTDQFNCYTLREQMTLLSTLNTLPNLIITYSKLVHDVLGQL